jgi:hypothetical protein
LWPAKISLCCTSSEWLMFYRAFCGSLCRPVHARQKRTGHFRQGRFAALMRLRRAERIDAESLQFPNGRSRRRF